MAAGLWLVCTVLTYSCSYIRLTCRCPFHVLSLLRKLTAKMGALAKTQLCDFTFLLAPKKHRFYYGTHSLYNAFEIIQV
jgi:hypothetical protein